MLTRAQLAREKALANNPPQATPPDKPQQQQTPAGLGDLEILPLSFATKSTILSLSNQTGSNCRLTSPTANFNT
jgi:hypothetical protein